MFSIYLLDSSKLFQWDLNRKIKIIGKEEVDEVHFSHIGDEEALVVKPIKENNILIANIPNILLQEHKDIFVYLVSKDKTLKETFFTVGRREKPTDYLYTEIDILNYSSLEKRLVELEEKLKNIPVEETDPTVPDWAKQPNKPKYTAGEVGALSSTETVRQLAQKQDKSNLVTSINALSADSTYPSTRAVYEYVGEEFARLIGSAPEALDTIEELANAFNDNQDILDALNEVIAKKQDKDKMTTAVSSDSTDDQYPSAKAVVDYVGEEFAKREGCFVTNITYENNVYKADKTFEELFEAYEAGEKVVAYCRGFEFQVSGSFGLEELHFTAFEMFGDEEETKCSLVKLTLFSDETIEVKGIGTRNLLTKEGEYKGLKTTSKRVIGAINEIKDEVKNALEVDVIKPLPVLEESYNETVDKLTITVNVDELEANMLYKAAYESHANVYVKYVFVCTDGTRKTIIASENGYRLIKVTRSDLQSFISVAFDNTTYKVNYGDKSTADVVTVEKLQNQKYLGINNSTEFIPTSDYQPVTKKYVDDECSRLSEEIAEIKQNGIHGDSGLTDEEKNIILTLFQNAVFTTDQSENIQALYNLFFSASEEIEVVGITLSHTDLTFEDMNSKNLVATLSPNGATGIITWTSTNENVAKVSQLGAVTPVSNGNCVITASIKDYSASCNITVNVSVIINIKQEGSVLTIIDAPNVTQDGSVLTIS